MRHSALGLNLREKLIDLGQNALNDAVDSLGVGMDGVFLHEASVERDTIEEEGIEHRAVAFCEIGIDRAELMHIIRANVARRLNSGDAHWQALRCQVVENLGERSLDLCRRYSSESVVGAKLDDDRARIEIGRAACRG